MAPEICYLEFTLTARADLEFTLEEPDDTLGRAQLELVSVHCRNEA